MRIAILGGGFAGLGTALSLLLHSRGTLSLDLYDPIPLGQGVSGQSAGLLHPFPGRKGSKVVNSEDLMKSAHALITEATTGMNRSLILSKGILRPATTYSQRDAFKKIASEYPAETLWWEREECQKKIPGLVLPSGGGGLYILEGITLDVPGYLQGLFQRGAHLGMQFYNRVLGEEEFSNYDAIVFASGIHVKHFPPLAHLPLSAVKGQSLVVKWPPSFPPLPCSLIGEGYVVMNKDQKSCTIGATFERDFRDEKPDPEKAFRLLEEKLSFFPSLLSAEILSCQAGIRATTPTHLPLLGKVGEKFWYITGLGAKGLLYHGYLADHLAKAILAKDTSLLPHNF